MKKTIGSIIVASIVLMAPMATYADTVSSTTASAQVQSMLTQIQALQAQIKSLQALQTQVQTAKTSVVSTLQLMRNLREGMSGSDVTALQTILAADPTIYPEGTITGYYGKLTSAAMRKFQQKYGIETVGYVGPKTLKKLNEVIKELGLEQERDNASSTAATAAQNGGNRFCIPPGHMIAKGWLKKNDKPDTSIVPLCNSRHDDDNHGIPSQATSTPTLTSVASSSVVVGSAIHDTVTLAGGNNPTGTLSFQLFNPSDTTCSVPVTPALADVTVNGNGTYTSANFNSTTTGTYRFIAKYSGDLKNYPVQTICNAAGSTVVVTAVPDTTAPTIAALNVVPAATSTTISWTTNEAATGAIWFGTTTPLALGTSTAISSTTQSLVLSGLATSTPYLFQVVAKDGSGNTATSTQSTFTTLAQ